MPAWEAATNPDAFDERHGDDDPPIAVRARRDVAARDRRRHWFRERRGTDLADVSTGTATADLINVAFRSDEPVRIRMDREQALTLGRRHHRPIPHDDRPRQARRRSNRGLRAGAGLLRARVHLGLAGRARNLRQQREPRDLPALRPVHPDDVRSRRRRAPGSCGSIRDPAAPPTSPALGCRESSGSSASAADASCSRRALAGLRRGTSAAATSLSWKHGMTRWLRSPSTPITSSSPGIRWAASAPISSGCCTRIVSPRRSR